MEPVNAGVQNLNINLSLEKNVDAENSPPAEKSTLEKTKECACYCFRTSLGFVCGAVAGAVSGGAAGALTALPMFIIDDTDANNFAYTWTKGFALIGATIYSIAFATMAAHKKDCGNEQQTP